MSRLSKLKEKVEELSGPLPSPTAPPIRGEATKMAFCPVLLDAVGVGYCKEPSCGTCPYLAAAVGSHRWLCSTCADGKSVFGYWTDGACDECGYDSIVLVLYAD